MPRQRVCVRCRRTIPTGRCPHCTTTARKRVDRDRPTAAARGYDRRWQATRTAYLAEHPLCECDRCAPLPVQPLAEDVHHIDGRGPLGPHGHCWHNLAALTHACHARITATQNGAFGRPITTAPATDPCHDCHEE